MERNKRISLNRIIAIFIISSGVILSIVSYFFNQIIPSGIISPEFPPFYVFEIGIFLIVVGLILFKWNKIRSTKKKITIVIVIIVSFFLVFSLPIILSSPITTNGLIYFEEIVWEAGVSITTESDVRNLFSTNGMEFWNYSIEALKSHGLYYQDTYTPLFDQIVIESINKTISNGSQRSGPNMWSVAVPALIETSEWRYGFWSGYVENSYMGYGATNNPAMPLNVTNWTSPIPMTKQWSMASYLHFHIDQQTGTIWVFSY